MQNNTEFHWKLLLKDIGPHEETKLEDVSRSLQIGIYANNGVGKTFVSRVFEAVEQPNKYGLPLVQWGKKEGKFHFQITQEDEVIEEVKAIFKGNCESTTHKTSKYLYYVFNQDYVKQNLDIVRYKPDGNITGIVLGKERIDLTKEKIQLQQLKEKGEELKKEIIDTFETRRVRLRKEDGVNRSTTEYKRFTFEEVEKNNLFYDETSSYQELKIEYRELSNLPDELMDISMLKPNFENSFLDELQKTLDTSYAKSFFEESFKREIHQKESFIEEGISYIQNVEEAVCPFCHQYLGEEAAQLIHRYTAYLEDEENKIIRKLRKFQENLEELKQNLEKFYNHEYVQCRREYNCAATYFKYQPLEVMPLNQGVIGAINNLYKLIENKKLNISLQITTHQESVQVLKRHICALKNTLQSTNAKIQQINRIKNNNDKQKLELRKRICRAVFNETVNSLTPKIEYLNQLRKQYRDLNSMIKEKEYIYRTDKRKLVAITFQQLLQVYFGARYTFNEEDFCLRCSDRDLVNQADKILSEGEKEVIAFCYYLASVHTKVNLEEDYDKIFLVIDDPVAHMDRRYTQYTSEVLEQLSTLYCLTDKMKYIILSHRQDFIEMLMEKKCIERYYTLKENNILLGNSEVAVSQL